MITIQSHSGIHTLKLIQKLPVSMAVAWDFMSSPGNLAVITPDKMGFQITSELDSEKMYAGQIITYKVSPIAGIKLNWVTEITHVAENEYFVDEQRFGPYAMWHHKHLLSEIDGGVEMVDQVSYKLPMGFLGQMANSIMVKSQLREIFTYRFHKLVELFGPFKE